MSTISEALFNDFVIGLDSVGGTSGISLSKNGAHESESTCEHELPSNAINLRKRRIQTSHKTIEPKSIKNKITSKKHKKASEQTSKLSYTNLLDKRTSKKISFEFDQTHSSDDSLSHQNDSDIKDEIDIMEYEASNKEPSSPLPRSFQVYDLNSMTKAMQIFKGAADDHFETWEENTKLYLKQYSNIPEDKKVTAVLLKIHGYPRMILRQHHPNLKSLDELFNALRPTYGADEFTMMNEIKQLQDESVRVFFSRLKTNLHLLGYSDSSKGNRIFLNHFINGLLPSVRTAVRALKPQRIEDAVSIAQEVESDRLTDDTRKTKKEKLDTLSQINDTLSLNVLNDKLEQMNKMIQDKLNAVNCRRKCSLVTKYDALYASLRSLQTCNELFSDRMNSEVFFVALFRSLR